MTIITNEQLIQRVFREGIHVLPETADRWYVHPSDSWFIKTFPEDLAWVRHTYRLQYKKEAFDCDNFADFARAFANMLHARTAGGPKAGLSVAEFAYTREDGEDESILMGITATKVHYLNPQNGLLVPITPKEKLSCFGVWF